MSGPTKACRFCGAQMPLGFVHCERCGPDQDSVPWGTDEESPAADASPMAGQSPEPPAVDPMDRSRCSHCGQTGSRPGILDVRTGGTSGGWAALLGDIVEVGERVTSIQTRTCEACGHIDLYAW